MNNIDWHSTLELALIAVLILGVILWRIEGVKKAVAPAAPVPEKKAPVLDPPKADPVSADHVATVTTAAVAAATAAHAILTHPATAASPALTTLGTKLASAAGDTLDAASRASKHVHPEGK